MRILSRRDLEVVVSKVSRSIRSTTSKKRHTAINKLRPQETGKRRSKATSTLVKEVQDRPSNNQEAKDTRQDSMIGQSRRPTPATSESKPRKRAKLKNRTLMT